MEPSRKRSTNDHQWLNLPLNKVFSGITVTVLIFLCIVLVLGIRQYLLYAHCRQAVAAGDQLLFHFTAINTHLTTSLVTKEPVNLQSLNRELQGLEREVEELGRDILVPEGLKATLPSRTDLVGLEVRLRTIQDRGYDKAEQTAQMVATLSALNIGLQQFRFHMSDHNQQVLLGLYQIIAGALGLIVALSCTLLFLLNRRLAAPILHLCRLTGTDEHVCSMQELTEKISGLLAVGAQHAQPCQLAEGGQDSDRIRRHARQCRYAVMGYVSGELASEMTNLINGVINYTQTLIDVEDQGTDQDRRKALHASLLKEEKKVSRLIAGIHLICHWQPSRSETVSLDSLFSMLQLLLDKPMRTESITLTVPENCRHEVRVPPGDLWLVLLTLVQSGRQALNRTFPGRSADKSMSVECITTAQHSHQLRIDFTNSAQAWAEETVDGENNPVWPSFSFCTQLMHLHQASLTPVPASPEKRLQLVLPCRITTA